MSNATDNRWSISGPAVDQNDDAADWREEPREPMFRDAQSAIALDWQRLVS